MKRVLVVLIMGTVLSGLAAYAATAKTSAIGISAGK
ncbi:MAG: hypothetical protein ACJASD_003135 [Sphingomonas echinoides]|jgi:hypothetical protein